MLAEHPPFRPRKLLDLPHVQTIGAFFLRGPRIDYRALKHVVPLRDGDRLVIHDDQPNTWITGDRIVVLAHGFCGCHSSPYVVRAAEKLQRLGVRTIRIDFRGFGASTLISKSHLSAGCSSDLEDVIRFVHQLSPISQLSLIGFSMGGNIILKLAGEWGENYPAHVDSAVAVSPPVDLNYAAWNIRSRGNRIYEAYFIRRLKSQLTLRRRQVQGLVDNGMNPLPDRLAHWDDQFTAPVWGYSGARDYYSHASSGPLMKDVRLPVILLTAEDDPVVPFDSYDRFAMSSSIDVIATRRGGHLGFLGRSYRDPDRYWMDWRICNWIASLDSK